MYRTPSSFSRRNLFSSSSFSQSHVRMSTTREALVLGLLSTLKTSTATPKSSASFRAAALTEQQPEQISSTLSTVFRALPDTLRRPTLAKEIADQKARAHFFLALRTSNRARGAPGGAKGSQEEPGGAKGSQGARGD